MPLAQRIEDEYKAAFRGGQRTATEVLRLLKTAFQNAEIEKRGKSGDREAKLTEEEALAIVKRQVKQLEEAGELFVQGGRADLKEQNDAELNVLKKYLPAMMDEEKVRAAVKRVISGMGSVGPADFGRVMGAAMKELKGGADGTVVSRIVKEMLIF
ncbi:GatB/YqeY domain-containing protein [Candidatus Uhrbacteria bacterium]|nr:GatB/YqeY domain-containing protein [Candidatus Uhrbacteria bacterium]